MMSSNVPSTRAPTAPSGFISRDGENSVCAFRSVAIRTIYLVGNKGEHNRTFIYLHIRVARTIRLFSFIKQNIELVLYFYSPRPRCRVLQCVSSCVIICCIVCVILCHCVIECHCGGIVFQCVSIDVRSRLVRERRFRMYEEAPGFRPGPRHSLSQRTRCSSP